MRLNVHDFSGHPFQAQLSRSLAARGHEVLHGYSAQYVTGHGDLTVHSGDPQTLQIQALQAMRPLVKYAPAGRIRFELAYARAWRRELERARLERGGYDVVVACNVPLLSMTRMRRYFAERRQPWVFWHQDIYSAAMGGEATKRLPAIAAKPVAAGFARAERALVRDADAVVAIGEPFFEQYGRWNLSTEQVTLIPNWAPVDDLRPGPRENAWSTAQRLPETPVRLMYAGTLGRKHNPRLLLNLLDEVKARGVKAVLIVVSEGVGAEDLAASAAGRLDVKILGFQPAEAFSDVLASADVMIALLEPDAAQFSVPSKVLSYLSAGRPTLGLMPLGNPAAIDIEASGGFVAAPSSDGVHAAASWLAQTGHDLEVLAMIGKQARLLAESKSDITTITDQFEHVLARAVGGIRPFTTRPRVRNAARQTPVTDVLA